MSRGVAYVTARNSVSAESPDEVAKYFELVRGNALTRRSACVFVATVAFGTFAVAGYFSLQGFWPILPFAGAEIALLIWAVRASMRMGLARETIKITDEKVSVEHFGPDGEWTAVFPRHWTKVKLHAPLSALHPTRLILESSGRAHEVGRFLTEDDRRGLAVRLKQFVGNVNESPALR